MFVSSLYRLAPTMGLQVTNNINDEFDAILCVGIDRDETRAGISLDECVRYSRISKRKIIYRVNENDARKGTNYVDGYLIGQSNNLNKTIFVSNWLQTYFEQRGWNCKDNCVIVNGVDKSIFKSAKKLNNGKINIVTHHWSNNHLKGFDIYDKLDEWIGHNPEYTFTYIGRHRNSFRNSTTIGPLYGENLGAELAKYDVYISASRFDPGPNHIIESVACNLPTYAHNEGGGCVEFVGEKHVYDSWEDLLRILENKKFENNSVQFDNWEASIEKYVKAIKETLHV